ncbi:MAG: adenylate cyclase, partial [Deltaproteobacteria bacterium]|nr:adenylate cyclase [Deltaproteobacteria bacterium]
MTTDDKPAPEAIRVQLERILQSDQFKAPGKQRKFLNFVVEETLEGRTDQIKGYTIAVTVYGRNEKFDPQTDPIVRVEAGRLRRALEHYYLTAGKNDPARIKIPKGSYVPTFHAVRAPQSETKMYTSERDDGSPGMEPSIAVMPFINLTGDREQDYFTDGLT